MCGSLLRFLVGFNLVATLVIFAAADGQVGVAAEFAGCIWATTLATAASLDAMARRLIGRSAGC